MLGFPCSKLKLTSCTSGVESGFKMTRPSVIPSLLMSFLYQGLRGAGPIHCCSWDMDGDGAQGECLQYKGQSDHLNIHYADQDHIQGIQNG